MKARIYVTLKPGVLDPQGQAVRGTLSRLGFEEVADVRIGKYVEIELTEMDADRARARLDDMCRRLIANTVIEDYRIEIDG
ncbi:MAG: phosphoribosylformylglycinamidine synthase subunit PurS [Deltaproteobacteria bacterium]|nr:MAG: phosphoribosylformylglycinamidine synthase subunit PurS [Deltaproteobacteria bacterium]